MIIKIENNKNNNNNNLNPNSINFIKKLIIIIDLISIITPRNGGTLMFNKNLKIINKYSFIEMCWVLSIIRDLTILKIIPLIKNKLEETKPWKIISILAIINLILVILKVNIHMIVMWIIEE